MKNKMMAEKILMSITFLFFFNAIIINTSAQQIYPIDSSTYIFKKATGENLKLSVFYPAKKWNAVEKMPAIILFHGGGWTAGNRSQMFFQCRYFASRGMIAVSPDYRLIKQSKNIDSIKRICLLDAKSAVRWVKSHAAMLHIDTATIVLGGGSAGGHLATMAALNDQINDPDDNVSISTKACALVLFNPAYKLDGEKDLEPYDFVSLHVPPVIMFFGSEDKWKIPADTFYNALKKNKVKVQMWIAPQQRHAFFNKDHWNLITCIKGDEFLQAIGILNKHNAPAFPYKEQLYLKQ